MLAWEESYLAHACAKRRAQLAHLQRLRSGITVIIGLGRSSPLLASVGTFVVLSYATELTAEAIFPAIALFNGLRIAAG